MSDQLPERVVENINLNLDSLEREGRRPAPYEFRLEGRTWSLEDPEDLDFNVLSYTERPVDILREALGDQYADFSAIKLPAWKANKLVDDYVNHYDLGN